MQKYQDVVLKPDGSVIQGASVLVQSYPGAITSTIYSDDGVTVQANPMTTDSLGRFAFYAADGQYQLVVSGNSIATQTITDILLDSGISVETGSLSISDASGASLSLAGSVGVYTKIGREVFVSAVIVYPATANTLDASVLMLPFNVPAAYATGGGMAMMTGGGLNAWAYLTNGGDTVQFYKQGTSTKVKNNELSGLLVTLKFSYPTA